MMEPQPPQNHALSGSGAHTAVFSLSHLNQAQAFGSGQPQFMGRAPPGPGMVPSNTAHGVGDYGAHVDWSSQSITGLPTNLLRLFKPKPELPFMEPLDDHPPRTYSGVSSAMSFFDDPDVDRGDTEKVSLTRVQRNRKRISDKSEQNDKFIAEKMKLWDPKKDEKIEGDPYRTLFVSNLNYSTTEEELKYEFCRYGRVKNIRIVTNSEGKPRGYAFVEFEKEDDWQSAFKYANGLEIRSRRVRIDVERGRVVADWKPRCLGGGLGKSRAKKWAVKSKRFSNSSTTSGRGDGHSGGFGGRGGGHSGGFGGRGGGHSGGFGGGRNRGGRFGGGDRYRTGDRSRSDSRYGDQHGSRSHGYDRRRDSGRSRDGDGDYDRDRRRERGSDRDRHRDRGRYEDNRRHERY